MEKKKMQVIANGVVIRQPDNIFGYYAWPSVARNDDGELIVTCSGNRIMHVCPFGKVIMRKSRDEGKTWSAPIIAIDTPLDDRDSGILNLGGGKMLVSSFNNNRWLQERHAVGSGVFGTEIRVATALAYLKNITDEMEEKYLGSLLSISEDNGYSWGEPFKAPVSAPHGPNLMRDGSLIYAGNPYEGEFNVKTKELSQEFPLEFPIAVYKSENCHDFVKLAGIPICPEIGPNYDYCEPHIIELPSGRLVLHIRADEHYKSYGEGTFSVVQSISDDGGKTWTVPKLLGCKNGPPHLLLHSSGTLICAYGRRESDYGIQVMISRDEAETWDMGYYIWDQGVDIDLGYPCSVELENGDIFTVYYGKYPGDTMTSILWTRWRLPE